MTDEIDHFKRSDLVVLRELSNDSLNGQIGQIVCFDRSTGRYAVKVGDRCLAVKPDNLVARRRSAAAVHK